MRAWLPEGRAFGPFPAEERDIAALNRVFAEAFTDRYRRDGLVGVRVPALNPAVWRYALRGAGDGAMVWRDDDGDVVAFNVAHRSGAEGWMGPLAVRPDRQGAGLGKAVVRAAVDWLLRAGVTTLGLETMPRTVENIGFYARLGFVPGHLTITMTHDIRPRGHPVPDLLSARGPRAQDEALAAVRALAHGLAPGVDYTREMLLTAELGLGDTSLVRSGERLDAAVLWHAAPLAESRLGDEIRVLKLAAVDERAFDAAISATEAAAARLGIRRVAVRGESRFGAAFRRLSGRGYRVRWTDLRMTHEGKPEPHLAAGVLFSNWEI
ncbi:MAG: GNAT family N-acetyltransferase [Gemmatimonadales bacterium]